jgi:hypothetical protein
MIRQRILYVGIGGSGLDLGVKLDEALRREICGLDGRALIKSGAFPDLAPNQLPQFVQSLYIDFAAESLSHITRNIRGGNAVAASNLIPTIDNYSAVATSLRLHSSADFPWIPPSAGEPNIKPLNGGAGQYPTVGRAAFFESVKSQTYSRAIGADLSRVINQLDKSMGELSAYTGQNCVSDVAVYVGFSMSGGTGCGIFLDVLQLLMYEFHKQLPKVGVTILPIVLLPSTFDGLLPADNARRAKLNAARALLDLAETIEQLQQPNNARRDDFKIKYPDTAVGASGVVGVEFLGKAPMIPVATLVEKPDIMDRDDVARSVAASIVAQSSVVREAQGAAGAVGAQPENKNSFIEDLINLIPEIQSPHKFGLGTHPLMPMISASLTLPSRKIADIVAKQIIADGLDEIDKQQKMQGASAGNWKEVLTHLRLDDLTRPETFDSETNLKFNTKAQPKTASELEEQLNRLRGQISAAMPAIESLIKQRIAQRSVFQVLDGLRKYLDSEGLKSGTDLPGAIITAGRALTELETKRTVDSSVSKGKAAKAGKKFALLPRKLDPAVIRTSFDDARKKFESEVEAKWWQQWSNQSAAWANSVETGKAALIELQRLLETLKDEFEKQVLSDQAELGQTRIGVVNFVPTNGRAIADALEQLTIDTATQIRRNRQIEDQSPAALLRSLACRDGYNAWSEMVDRLSKKANQTQIFDALIEPVRDAVEEAMAGTEAVPGTLPRLGQLLLSVSNATASPEGIALRRALGELMPDGLIPGGSFKTGKVLISYPGTKNEAVQRMIKDCLSLGGKYRDLLSKNAREEWIATGDSDVVTVNVNLVGQGLLDNRETREILLSWREAITAPKDDKLKWRQRKNFKNIDQIFTGRTQDHLLSAMVSALFSGTLEVTAGSLTEPTRLLLRDSSGQVADLARVEIEVPLFPGFSSWPNVLYAFERMVLGIDTATDFRGDVVGQMFTTRPPILQGDVNAKVPDVVRTILGLRKSELEKLRTAAGGANYGEGALRMINNAIEFWERGLVNAIEYEVPGAFYKSLGAAISEREPTLVWR